MEFDIDKLNTYKELLNTTEIQEGYQEFIKLFRYLRIELEKELDGFSFSKNIVENRMNFAYFQLFNDELKAKGLKIQVVFVHKEYQFEVWVSGYNRKIQCDYYNCFKNMELEYSINNNPERVDYIIKSQLSKELDISKSDFLIEILKSEISKILKFVKDIDIKK